MVNKDLFTKSETHNNLTLFAKLLFGKETGSVEVHAIVIYPYLIMRQCWKKNHTNTIYQANL